MSWWCPKMIMARHFQLHDWKKLLKNCRLIRLNTWTRSEQKHSYYEHVHVGYVVFKPWADHGLLYKNAILKNACNYFPQCSTIDPKTHLDLCEKETVWIHEHTCQTWIQPIPQRHFINSRGWTMYIYTQTYTAQTQCVTYIYIHHYISYVCMLVPSRSYTARKGGNFEINQDVVRPTMKSEQSKQRKTMQNL